MGERHGYATGNKTVTFLHDFEFIFDDRMESIERQRIEKGEK